MTDNLAERWLSRDRPVLIALARRLDAPGGSLDVRIIAEELNRPPDEVVSAALALDGTYITGTAADSQGFGGGPPSLFVATGLTERGRREVGLWPEGESAADALLDALRQAEILTDDPDDKSALRKAAGQLGSVSRTVFADLTTAYIRSQTGL